MSWFGPNVAKVHKWREAAKYDEIKKLLGSGQNELAEAAFTIMLADRPEELKSCLLDEVHSYSPPLRKKAVRLLLDRSFTDRATQALFFSLLEDPEPKLQRDAMDAFEAQLESLPGELVSKALKIIQKQDNAWVHEFAFRVLKESANKDHRIAAIKLLLADRESEPTRQGLYRLVGDGETDDLLGAVRSGAPKELKETFLRAMTEGSETERIYAIRAVSSVRWPDVKVNFIELLRDANEGVAAAAREAIDEFGGIDKDDWIKLLAHELEALRLTALDELIPHLDPELLDLLLVQQLVPKQAVIGKIMKHLKSMEDPAPLIAEIIMGLQREIPAYEQLITAVSKAKEAPDWLASDSVLNAVFALLPETRERLARLLLRNGHEDAVIFYYHEIDGSEPPAELMGPA